MNENSSATDNFIEAIAAFVMPHMDIEYRVYYDPVTRVCTSKTTEKLDGHFVIVTLDQYEKINMSGRFYVTKSGKINKKELDFTASIMLQLNEVGQYHTIKNNNIFIVDSNYDSNIDSWSLKG